MEQLNELINYFKNMSDEKIVDVLIAVIIIAVFFIFSSLLSYLIIKIFMRKAKKEKIKSNAFYLPLKILFIFIGLYIAIYILKLPEKVMIIWRKIFKIVVICIVAKGLVNLVDPKSEIAKKLRKKDETNEDKTVAKFAGRILKYIIYIFAGFFIISELDYDISGLVAGLGIGGAVVALAAQDFVKSLISGMSILADKPFLVGDWIEVGTNQGTVVDISFRATKIKTVDNSVITMQNSVLTNNTIVNWSRLQQRRYSLNLKLPLEINADKIDDVVNRLKFVLQTNEKVLPDTLNIYFNSIESDGTNIIIYLYTSVVDYNGFLQFRQEINEQILKVLESENVKLAYPGQNIYLINSEENEMKNIETIAERNNTKKQKNGKNNI